MRLFGALILVLALAFLVGHAAALSEISTSIRVEANHDGTAHIKETYALRLDSDTEIESFEQLRKYGQNTLISWRTFYSKLNYHVSGVTTPTNTTLTARRLFEIGTRSASIELEYDVPDMIFSQEKVGSRITRFTLIDSMLRFDRTLSGEVILSSTESLELDFPVDSTFDSDKFVPSVSTTGANSVTWSGPLSSPWKVSFETEEPLGQEVRDYFTNLFSTAIGAIPSFLPIAFVAIIVAFLVNKAMGGRRHK